MRDFLTEVALACAAILFSAWLLLVSRGRLAWAADRIAKTSRSAIAAFLFFVTVATVCAQKSGTNEPPRGASSGRVEYFDGRAERIEGANELLTTTEHAETAVADTENGLGRITDRLPQPPVRVAEGASEPSVVELFRPGSVATNETWDFSAPSGAEVHERWQRRGACDIVELWNYGIAEMRKWEAT